MASRGFWRVLKVGCVAEREKPLEGFKMASRGFWRVLTLSGKKSPTSKVVG